MRRALQAYVGLPQRDGIPIVGLVTRLDWQKGLDITGEVIHRLMNNWAGEAQFVVLGSGAPEYEQMFANLAYYHRDKMTAVLEYNAGLAPLIYAGTDMFLVPSRFEPCGLSQLISMRYGSVPVVRATGGLADTVWDNVTGFVFHDYNTDAFWHALSRAIYVYNTDKPHWEKIQRTGMALDFSWERSAVEYEQMYQTAIGRNSG
jgi:starch synthase